MANRFENKQSHGAGFMKMILPVGSMLLMLIFVFTGVNMVQAETSRAQQRSLEDALRRSAIHCYVSEGAYPESLDYITQHYGIRYDEQKYFVRYVAFASNFMPQISVISLQL